MSTQSDEEIVNFGSQILAWDLDALDSNEHDITASMMFRQYLELIDSISILIRRSSTDACKAILRNALEIFLGLEYLLEADTVNRAKAFSYWHLYNGLLLLRRTDPDDDRYKQFISKIKQDKLMVGIDPVLNISGIKEMIERIAKDLKSNEFSEVRKAHARLLNKRSHPNWYSILSKIHTVEKLANYLNRQAFYEIYYRAWSAAIHGTDAILNRFSLGKDFAKIYMLRYPKDAQKVTQAVFQISLICYKIMIDKRLRDHNSEFIQWYGDMREYYIKLTTEERYKMT